MKNSLPYILILAILIIAYQFLNPKVITNTEIEYKEGKKDTLFIPKIVKSIDTLYQFQTDTLKIDSNGSKSFTTAFNVKVDSLTGVSGTMSFYELTESFGLLIKELWYPELYVTQVDTLTETITIENSNPFYDTFIFGFGSALLIAIAILFTLN